MTETFKVRLEIEDEYPMSVGPRTLKRLMRRGIWRVFLRQWLAVPAHVKDAQALKADPEMVPKPVTIRTVTKVHRRD